VTTAHQYAMMTDDLFMTYDRIHDDDSILGMRTA